MYTQTDAHRHTRTVETELRFDNVLIILYFDIYSVDRLKVI